MWHGTWERRRHGHLQPEAVVKAQTQQLQSRRERFQDRGLRSSGRASVRAELTHVHANK